MRRETDDTAAALTLATDVTVSWLVRRALTQDRGARAALFAHAEGELRRVVGTDDALRAVACDARRIVRRLAGDVPRLRAV